MGNMILSQLAGAILLSALSHRCGLTVSALHNVCASVLNKLSIIGGTRALQTVVAVLGPQDEMSAHDFQRIAKQILALPYGFIPVISRNTLITVAILETYYYFYKPAFPGQIQRSSLFHFPPGYRIGQVVHALPTLLLADVTKDLMLWMDSSSSLSLSTSKRARRQYCSGSA